AELVLTPLVFLFARSHAHFNPLSFPTRRSSDLLRTSTVSGFIRAPCPAAPTCPRPRYAANKLIATRNAVPTRTPSPRSRRDELEIGRAQSELQSRGQLVCRLALEKQIEQVFYPV